MEYKVIPNSNEYRFINLQIVKLRYLYGFFLFKSLFIELQA